MILSLCIAIPAVASLLVLFLPRTSPNTIRWTALLASLAAFFVSLVVLINFQVGEAGFQMVEKVPWVPSIGADWHLGVDGISLFLVVLTTLLTVLCIISSWHSITDRVRDYHFFFLLLEAGMIGVFVALDLFVFYVMWEVMLVPMFFLIGVWGGQRRLYATIKFFLFTMAGSVLMLAGILYVYFNTLDPETGKHTFDLLLATQQSDFALNVQRWLFLAFGLAFAIKVPLFPLHTWLPDAHTEAPTAGSVILAGVLLKMGTYGFLRFCLPMFPQATLEFVPWISWLALIGIVYGALVAMVQKDMKKLVAYSSVAHLGFVMLGTFALNQQGLTGSLLQQINHGISTGALFLLVGVVYERRHTRLIADYGGIAKFMPVYATLFLIIALSSIGLPTTNGFVGEFLILLGTFSSNTLYGVIATSGVILAAVYLLWMYQRVFYGQVVHEENSKLKDITLVEALPIVVLVLLAIWIGVYPEPLIVRMEPSLQLVLDRFQQGDFSMLLGVLPQ
ncbi:MAG: NADH-quinone oxidoreductase subunit M [Calditrichaeota bacterium]|nr:NADH-quinone oxidoreductase subunit M [Calditrichota bacterium]MCB9368423.1 NADH-quinone oxidoreductase subunit M [Calditrichota bacterium]